MRAYSVLWHFSGCKPTQVSVVARNLRDAANVFCNRQGFALRGFSIQRKRDSQGSRSIARTYGYTNGAGVFNATIIPF